MACGPRCGLRCGPHWLLRLLLVLPHAAWGLQGSPGNTTISFFNAGACSAVSAVIFEFDDPDRVLCPSNFRSGRRCKVPGPYGRQTYATLGREISYLDITLLDPSDDDSNLTVATRIYLAPKQKRNHVGASVRPGTLAAACALGFTVGNIDPSAGDIAPRYFRSIFRHAAVGVGAMSVVSNGDSTITSLAPGAAHTLDQMLVSKQDMPTEVVITFTAAAGGASAQSERTDPVRLWGSTCELCVPFPPAARIALMLIPPFEPP
jgi:hypothetical protein